MTTFQDPPPQSRRAARQNERSDLPGTSAFSQVSQAAAQQAYYGQQAQAPQGYPPQGSYQAPPEPLNYSTQGAQPGQQFTAAQQSSAAYGSPSAPESAGFRVRDFSPEGGGRRSSGQPPADPRGYAGYSAGASDLNYHTQALPLAGYAATGAASAPAAGQPSSRREQRQRQSEQERAGFPAVQTGPQAPYNPALLSQSQPQPSMPPAPPAGVQYPTGGYPPAAYAAAAQPGAYPAAGYPAAVGQPMAYQGAPAPRQTVPPTALSNAMAEFGALTRGGQPQDSSGYQRIDPQGVVQGYLDPALEQTGGWVAPVGHWSRQADLDDETQPWEGTITREVGGGNVATTTSALVLPEIPRADPFATALASTGEVLLTGSIDLPRTLGSRGGDNRRYDDPGVDRMFDTQDAEYTGTDSSPVRAIRAVSTHASARGVIHANKPHGNRLLIAVFVGTAVLAVAVVGMLAVSLASGLF